MCSLLATISRKEGGIHYSHITTCVAPGHSNVRRNKKLYFCKHTSHSNWQQNHRMQKIECLFEWSYIRRPFNEWSVVWKPLFLHARAGTKVDEKHSWISQTKTIPQNPRILWESIGFPKENSLDAHVWMTQKMWLSRRISSKEYVRYWPPEWRWN